MTTAPRLLVAATLASVGAAALAAPGTVPGHAVAGPGAVDDRYVARLVDDGWEVVDRAQLIRVARSECAIRRDGTSNAELVAQVAAKYRISSESARSQLTAAESAYCPNQLGGNAVV